MGNIALWQGELMAGGVIWSMKMERYVKLFELAEAKEFVNELT